jgi:hypothetical protein
MAFKLNDKVTWTSSSNGSTKTKTGVVVEVVWPRRPISAVHREYGLEGYGLPRDHESYVVHIAGKTEKAKGRRYWPLVNKLKKA